MTEPKEIKPNESIPLAKLIDLSEIQDLPQLAATVKRSISAEADMLIKSDEGDSPVEDRISFLEETICELVELVASMETEAVERRRLKRIPR